MRIIMNTSNFPARRRHQTSLCMVVPRSPMARSIIDPNSGFCPTTNTFQSLHPPFPSSPPTHPLSAASFAFSLLPSPPPPHPAFINATTNLTLSYPSFSSQVRSLSSSLKSRFNLSKSRDVAFIISPMNLQFPVLAFSLLSLGVPFAPVNPSSTPKEVSRLFGLVKPTIVFAVSDTVGKLRGGYGVPVVLLDSSRFDDFLCGGGEEVEVEEVVQGDVAAIMFSSGTTGMVKAAALSHRSYVLMMAEQLAKRERMTDVSFVTAPLFHVMGFWLMVRGVALGETTVLMDRMGFEELMGAMERYKVTVLTAAPPMVVAMGRWEVMDKFDLGGLKEVITGGAPMLVEDSERFKARFPWIQLRLGYGSTEAGSISLMTGSEECRNLRSVGRLSQNFEAKIVDVVTHKPLSVGQRGELFLRGPIIMIGYIGDEEANASTFDSGGWLRTGDLCYFDNNGFLYIVDRLKEMIKYKAYQVSPIELEHVLQSITDVVDAAVIPYPHYEFGQIPMAVVVRKPGSRLDEAQVINFVAQQVAPYKKIRKVVFVNSIPKSAAGKILRKELANLLLSRPVPRL